MGERLLTYREPRTEISRPPQRPSIINVESSPDPESTAVECWWPSCEGMISQQLINYEFTLQGKFFRVMRVWSDVCDGCHDVTFSAGVSKQIEGIIFRRLHSTEAIILKPIA